LKSNSEKQKFYKVNQNSKIPKFKKIKIKKLSENIKQTLFENSNGKKKRKIE